MSTKEDIKQFLEDLGFTVSLDYEREPMGTQFADIHEHIHTIDSNLSTYQAFRALEIELMVIYRDWETDRKSTRLNSSHSAKSRMPSSA